MAVVRRACALALVALATPAAADGNMCRVVDLDFMPAELATAAPMKAPPQIVAWLEDPQGNYVDTIFITQQTGTFGLGNRPGRWDFNSGPKWPYGRRVGVFPIWAHRRAASGAPVWPEVVFQNDEESNLSHPFNESSRENHFCRPLLTSEASWDAGSCASAVYTDKGTLHPTRTSLYPPRNDVTRVPPDAQGRSPDDAVIDMYGMLNPFDAVSMATPPSGAPATVSWPIPLALPMGDYVLWVEVSREFDHNSSYSVFDYPRPRCTMYPIPNAGCCNTPPNGPNGTSCCINPPLPDGSCDSFGPNFGLAMPWAEYGEAYRGQPSIVYKVPFTLGIETAIETALDYEGYGSIDGSDGEVRPPDATITTGVQGSGAERLAVQSDGGTPYRVRLTARTEFDNIKPAAPTSADVNTLTTTSAVVEFTAPGDDGLVGKVKGYEIRYVAGSVLDASNFSEGIEIKPDIVIAPAGTVQEFPITGLLFDTEYTVGIRAFDDCRNTGPIALVTFRTPDRVSGEVDACFVATAAYGSVMANDVDVLRRFRDSFLKETVLGELAVEAYYTFGPAVAGVVGESELLRASARAALAPIIQTVKVLRF